jgi:hypothetical protein
MRLRTPIVYLGGCEFEAEVITEQMGRKHFRASLLVRGETLSPLIAAHADYEVLEATDEERSALLRSGYQMRGLAVTRFASSSPRSATSASASYSR